ncbi:MAG TPA: hypothetical protein VIO32_03650, partial [Candidatus Baltobacteraceae bacterium]
MILLHVLALAAAVSTAPTPQQYYARALDTMNALPQPAYATFDMDIKASGAEIASSCSPKAGAAFSIGWGRGMRHEIQTRGEYTLSGNAAAILEKGTYCRDDAAIFKPQWAAMHDWMRYGISGAPHFDSAKSPKSSKSISARLPTIANVTAVSPAAYDVFDRGAAVCPSGTPGHALHLIAVSNPDEHPLTDVIIEANTMRFCMMRFSLVNAVAAGTGAKGDMTVDFAESNGYWSITHGHAVLSLRMLGVSLKHFMLDTYYANMQYPTELEQIIPSKAHPQSGGR